MINTFAELKNTRKENFEKLQSELAKMATGQKFVKESEDPNFWQPTADKAGNGSAVIRFLPRPKGEDKSIVRVFAHGFEGPHGWYIEKSLSTFEDSQGNPKPDPVAEMNRKLWAQGKESEGQLFVSGNPNVKPSIPGSKRKLGYYANVYIVKDPAKPEYNGQVKIYKFGARVHDKIALALNPKFSDVEKFDPFDLFGGANFKLKFYNNEKGWRTYEASEWDLIEGESGVKKPRGPLFDDDDKMEKVWLQCHSLFQFVDASKFKTYNELKERLARIMGDKFDLFKSAPSAEDFKQTLPPWEENPIVDDEKVHEGDPVPDEGVSESEMQWFRDLKEKVQ